MKLTSSDIERFWSNVNKNGPIMREELGRCWIWIGGVKDKKKPYGAFAYRKEDGKKFVARAHRVSLELKLDRPIHEGLLALHLCDNMKCVNPDHLREGTDQDNVNDRTARKRHWVPGGSAHSKNTGLTEEKVLDMRRRYDAGESYVKMAKEYGIHHATAWAIVLRKTWRHV